MFARTTRAQTSSNIAIGTKKTGSRSHPPNKIYEKKNKRKSLTQELLAKVFDFGIANGLQLTNNAALHQ